MTTTTLKEACEAYTAHMKEKGQSQSTLGTIQRTLALLVDEMGEEKDVGKILPLHVDKFFKSERATMQPGKEGMKARADASVLQIRRIVRSALVWLHEQGLSVRLPLPATEKKYVEPKVKKTKTEKPKTARKKKAKTTKTDNAASGEQNETTQEAKPWTGFGDDQKPIEEGETIASFHFKKEGE
jgi:hypothetical protein